MQHEPRTLPSSVVALQPGSKLLPPSLWPNNPRIPLSLQTEQKLWAAAEKLRGHMDASEYKHVVLGLIFLKYISDAFEERHAELQKEKHADVEDRDEYAGANVFW